MEKSIYPIRFNRWKNTLLPKKILAIRFQALGDTIITLPYLQSLKRQHPKIILHFLTRKEVCAIPEDTDIFDKVIKIGGGRNAKLQFILTLFKLPYLLWQGYDVVLDLQKNKISVILRKLLAPKAWSEFDKYSPISAAERTQRTIEALGIWKVTLDTNFRVKTMVKQLLIDNGWNGYEQLVVLNPAGYAPSRNWLLDNYIEFAKRWLAVEVNTKFVLLLLPSLNEKATYISQALGDKCINLTGKANQTQAFAILKYCKLVLSEDSGLMHMAWVQGVPTVALFSSSRKDWSSPQGSWSLCLDSSDLECGPCNLDICKYGDNRCINRYNPSFVLTKARALQS